MTSLKASIASLLSKYPNGLKAKKIAELLGVDKQQINRCLYSSTNQFSVDDSYIWTLKAKANYSRNTTPCIAQPHSVCTSKNENDKKTCYDLYVQYRFSYALFESCRHSRRSYEELSSFFEICYKHKFSEEVMSYLLKRNISSSELRIRLEMISYYEREYPHLKLNTTEMIIASTEKFKKIVQEKVNPHAIRICTGNCSVCNRSPCIMENE